MASLLKIALTKGSKPKEKEFANIMHYLKQIIGLILGIAFGVYKMQGIASIVIGAVIAGGFCGAYSLVYLEIDEDEVENWKIFTEGSAIGICVFMLCWILTFSFY